jgi:23S rRNA G2445 N2-methylase RlmL
MTVRVFCRVTAGLEEIAWLDIQQSGIQAHSPHFSKRLIAFDVAGALTPLTSLKSVDDLYLHVATIEGIRHTQEELANLRRYVGEMDFRAAADQISTVRPLTTPITFYVTVSRAGKHNYSSVEIADVFAKTIQERMGWTGVDDFRAASINVRVLLDGPLLLVGLSLASHPLHRRSYKRCHLPGSLKPPVAYLMTRIAGCRADDVIVDPMCGVGTIPIEARLSSQSNEVYGSDISFSAIHCAAQNWQAAFDREPVPFFRADVGRYPLRGRITSKIISNPPWGKQLQTKSVYKLYFNFLQTALQIGREDIVCVVLTDHTQELMDAMSKLDAFELLWVRQISLYGSYPAICVLGGPQWIGRAEQAFSRISPIGTGIDSLIGKQGIRQNYT